jgi:ribosomal protein S27AE
MRNRVILMALGPTLPWLAWTVGKGAWLIRAGPRPGITMRLELIGLAVYSGYCLLFAVYMTRWRSRIRRQIVAAGGRVCFRCGYGLTGLDNNGICPECGEAFVLAALRERWVASGLCRREDYPLSEPKLPA